MDTPISSRKAILLTAVAALGYFVDVYDLIIFSVVRKASLQGIGVPDESMLSVGLELLNWQVAGVLLGGLLWGVFGDKKGRLSVLFGSIILYSVANLLNAYVTEVWQYKALRFIAGFGLAGELGAGITLVSEVVSKERRGIATMWIAAIGLLGAVLASEVGIHCDWRTSYIVGGIMGLCLLVLRLGTFESSLFEKLRNSPVQRGNLLMLVSSPQRLFRYIMCILAGAPLYFVIGILITLSPEFGKHEGLNPVPVAGVSVMVGYIAMSIGDIGCSALSQIMKSRRAAMAAFHFIGLAACLIFVFVPATTLTIFYAKIALLGFSIGFWAVLNTNAAEQFGTNLRASVATSVPNFVRALLIPISAVFEPLKANWGLENATVTVGVATVLVALFATWQLKESFGRNLDFNEQ